MAGTGDCTGLKSGESVEIEIGALATTGDAIVIPAAGSDFDGSPFNEYILVDLFTDEGVNKYDVSMYGLQNAAGVRIYHINANMEKRELEVGGKVYPIGTIHFANAYDSTGFGRYNVELIQAGGDNSFTDLSNLRTMVQTGDFFRAGDVFTADKYSEFLYQGEMDNGSKFGYSIEVVSIGKNASGEYKAKIKVTGQ